VTESSKAVFLSYASQDAEAAQRICEALRAAGIVVWFDQSELRGGDAWDASIRRKIKECTLFVPIVSRNTESRSEGYFRLEWKLAVDRSHLMADDQAFLLPVAIDDIPDASARVPDRFRERQWSRLPAAAGAEAFAGRVRRLLESGETDVPAATAPTATPPVRARAAAKSGFAKWIVGGLGVAAIAIVALLALRPSQKEPAAIAVNRTTAEAASAPAAAKPDRNSVAVLPFANLSDDKANEYFSDGISEELLTMLQKIPGLRVAARTSAFSFKGKTSTAQEIGEQLGVAHLVEGSVRKSGKSVRITARLSRASTGEQLWSDSYTRDLKDVFAVQSELARTIVEQLRAQLGGTVDASAKAEIQAQVQAAAKGGTKDPAAFELYLQGISFLHQFSPDAAARAADFLQRAVALDPSFALAWAAMSRAGSVRGGYALTRRDQDEGFVLARRAAERALALVPELPAARLARMRVQMWSDLDWNGAAESLRRAQKLAPADADVLAAAAELAYTFGRKEMAVELGRQAVSRDPANAEMRVSLGTALNSLGRYPEAEAEFRRVVELSPSAPWGHAGVGDVYLRQDRLEEAVREAARESDEWSRLTVQAQALWGLGRKAESDAALERLIANTADIAAFQIAQVYAYRRDNDRAFEWLERARRQRDPGLAWTRSDPALSRLHDDPRWPAFLAMVGLSDEQLK
jgi:TolB-like protein/Tfp pilus assembly protein PilF